MSEQLKRRLGALAESDGLDCLKHIGHGIEKESLRVDASGHIALTPHPKGLGSPLTHKSITTDFSEALAEFITPVFHDPADSLSFLTDVHRFFYSQLENGELLWTSSMPCVLGDDDKIPLAEYGSSNIGRLKTLYRRGLGHRYTRAMQTIAGVHYNFSLPDSFWPLYREIAGDSRELQEFRTTQYFELIRNFRRYSWLLLYLFGASPAVCKSFLRNRPDHGLDMIDENTFGRPFGTSLRMGDLGYTSTAQAELLISYNSLQEYLDGLKKAIKNPYPPYQAFDGTGGGHQQINDSILQIENEFYSPVRPKRVTMSGERPIHTLIDGGVEYVEVRCLDLNPFLPLGIDQTQIYFLNCFMLFCLLRTSPLSDEQEYREIQKNLIAVVNDGRDPELMLQQRGTQIRLREWADRILRESREVAKLLDTLHDESFHEQAVAAQIEKLKDGDLTPSAQIMNHMRDKAVPYFSFAMEQSRISNCYFQEALTEEKKAQFDAESRQSDLDRESIEKSDTMDFEDFLALANRI